MTTNLIEIDDHHIHILFPILMISLQNINTMCQQERPDWQQILAYVTSIYKHFETWIFFYINLLYFIYRKKLEIRITIEYETNKLINIFLNSEI